MATCKFVSKTDSEIITDLQNISSKITAFRWTGTKEEFDFSPALTDKEKAKVSAYFSSSDHKKLIEV